MLQLTLGQTSLNCHTSAPPQCRSFPHFARHPLKAAAIASDWTSCERNIVSDREPVVRRKFSKMYGYMRFSKEWALMWCAMVSDWGWGGEESRRWCTVAKEGKEGIPNSLMKRPPRSG